MVQLSNHTPRAQRCPEHFRPLHFVLLRLLPRMLLSLPQLPLKSALKALTPNSRRISNRTNSLRKLKIMALASTLGVIVNHLHIKKKDIQTKEEIDEPQQIVVQDYSHAYNTMLRELVVN